MLEKSKLLDQGGRPLTQSLFLEIGYTDFAVFTLKDLDYSYKGKEYQSLKRLYLEYEDPTEYAFANEYLLGWSHWVRLCENKQIRKYIDEWREELELKLRARAVKEMIKAAPESYQAAKWLADRGWATRGAGRPTKADIEGEKKVQARIDAEYGEDVVRLFQKQ
jgi:hypothetical protein